jgi:hypothetical protein
MQVKATSCNDLRTVVVKELFPNQWKDFDIGYLRLQVQLGGQWSEPSPRTRVPWTSESLPVRIVPLFDKRGNATEMFNGKYYSKIFLQTLISNPMMLKPEHLERVPAASNYMIETDFGSHGSFVRSIYEVYSYFSSSQTCLRDHLSCTNVSPGCALLVDPSWLE